MSHNGIDHRHCKWSLGTRVATLTPEGYLEGKICRHEKHRKHGCDIEFSSVVDMGTANGARFCHFIPFRSLRRLDPSALRQSVPWYKSGNHGK